MSVNDEDISTLPAGDGPEGPRDAGAGERADPQVEDGGADGSADAEGLADAGARQDVDPAEHDGGADGGA